MLRIVRFAAFICVVSFSMLAVAQSSIGRGAPDPLVPELLVGTETKGYWAAAGIPEGNTPIVATTGGDVPGGITPLPINIFSSKDFYLDEQHWFDNRYFLCNSPSGLEQIWGAYEVSMIGDNPPNSAPWGHCDRDYPREQIISPYAFTTAAAHYAALLEESQERGGPTQYTQTSLPVWNGKYIRRREKASSWFNGAITQVPSTSSAMCSRCITTLPPMPHSGLALIVGLRELCGG